MSDFKYIADAFAPIPNPNDAGKVLCHKFSQHVVSVEHSGHDNLINFGDGRVILRPAENGLHLRVEALDLATFFGIRSLLQVGFDFGKATPATELDWKSVSEMPFPVRSSRSRRV